MRQGSIQKAIVLTKAEIETPLGQMVVIADQEKIYVLQFIEHQHLSTMINRIEQEHGVSYRLGLNQVIVQLRQELTDYFAGKLRQFTVPIGSFGTPFQVNVWRLLTQITYGETKSYTHLADEIGNAKAVRAVANANRCNPIVIVVPCHRVIRNNGDLCGYSGGVERKQWLLHHEKTIAKTTHCSSLKA